MFRKVKPERYFTEQAALVEPTSLYLPASFSVKELNIARQVAKSCKTNEASERVPAHSIMWSCSKLILWLTFRGVVYRRFRRHETIDHDLTPHCLGTKQLHAPGLPCQVVPGIVENSHNVQC